MGLACFVPALAQDELTKLYSEAQQAQAAGDLATASRKYESILRLRPQVAEGYANLGNLYYQQGQTDRARTVYQKAIQLKPELAGPYFFLGVIDFGAHNYTSALRHLKRAELLQPDNGLIHSYLGYTYYALSEFRKAADELEKAAAENGADIDVLYHLSKSYGHVASNSFDQLRKQFPASAYTNLARAHLDETKEDWKGASQEYTLALEKLPGNARLKEKVRSTEARAAGAGAADTGTSEELIDASLAYRDAPLSGAKLKEEIARSQSRLRGLQLREKSDQTVYLIAENYQVLSYLSSLAVLDIDPDSYRAHELRAQLLETSNNDEGAIEEYQKVLKLKPDLQNIHFAIGSLYWKEQQFDAARRELEEELRLNPNHPQALYELGDLSAAAGETLKAEKYFLQALKLEPAMVEAHFALEKIYTQSGQYDKSLAHLQSALRIDPSDPTPHYRIAIVYRKLGRKQDADRELATFNQKQAEVKGR